MPWRASPSRTDLLEIFQALGRVHQRAHRNDQALAVWTRLEKLFPDDARVQEQIASSPGRGVAARAGAGAATRRWRRRPRPLSAGSSSGSRRPTSRSASAARPRPSRDFEGLLGRPRARELALPRGPPQDRGRLPPQRRPGRPGGLLRALAREGRPTTSRRWPGWAGPSPRQGRAAEARSWLDQAVKLAPSRKDAAAGPDRAARAGEEVRRGRRAVRGDEPGRPEQPRRHPRLGPAAPARHVAARGRAQAGRRRRLAAAASTPGRSDPAIAAQVADLFRQAEMADEAIALYQKAVELAPDSPQYREYLGEYYHALKRPDDALAAWRADRRRAEPERQEPGAAGRGPGRVRLQGRGDRGRRRGVPARPRRVRRSGSSTPTCCSTAGGSTPP